MNGLATIGVVLLMAFIGSANSQDDTVTAGPIVTTTKKFQIEIKNSGGNSVCKANNKEGICLLYSYCNENKTVLLYGDPDENDLRTDDQCQQFHHFCCVLEGPWKDNKDVPIPDEPGCDKATATDCPFCVALYKDGGNPKFQNPSGLFCGGILLGEELVLTTATCLAATKHQNVWAKLSSDPKKTYNVTYAIKHPKYHSGTRDFDYAVMELSEKVTSVKPACVQRQNPIAGSTCLAYGYDAQDNIKVTSVKVERSRCDSEDLNPDTNGGACGRPVDSKACRATVGTPVVCPYQGGYGLWGVSRSSCDQGYTHVGVFGPAETWAKPFLVVKPSKYEEKLKSMSKTRK